MFYVKRKSSRSSNAPSVPDRIECGFDHRIDRILLQPAHHLPESLRAESHRPQAKLETYIPIRPSSLYFILPPEIAFS